MAAKPSPVKIIDPLLSPRQCAEYADGAISETFIRRRITSGAIPVTRFGPRAIRVRLSDLQEYLETGDPA